MKKAVADSANPRSIAFESSLAVTPESLLPMIHKANPHVCHFAGNQEGGNILMRAEDGGEIVISDDAFEGLFQALGSSLRMIVMDTCQSARCARAVTKVVPFAMGVSGDILDDNAIAFYTNFYRSIAAGYSLGNAAVQARSVLSMNGSPEEEILVLFSRDGLDPKATHLVEPASD
jgi:hypothetical protein